MLKMLKFTHLMYRLYTHPQVALPLIGWCFVLFRMIDRLLRNYVECFHVLDNSTAQGQLALHWALRLLHKVSQQRAPLSKSAAQKHAQGTGEENPFRASVVFRLVKYYVS